MKKIGLVCALVFLPLTGIMHAKGLPMMPHSQLMNHLKTIKSTNSNQPNFSGNWVGRCEGDEQDIKLAVTHTDFVIKLVYPDFNASIFYLINGIENKHASIYDYEEELTTNASWSQDNSALILNSIFYFKVQPKDRFSSDISKSIMKMEGGNLIVTTKEFRLDSVNEDQAYSLTCVYHSQNKG